MFLSQAFTALNKKINNKKRNLQNCRFLNFSGQYNIGDCIDKKQSKRIFYNFRFRRNHLRPCGSCCTWLHSLVHDSHWWTGILADSSGKYQYAKQQSYPALSCRVRYYHFSGIYRRMYRKPRISYECLGLFRAKI